METWASFIASRRLDWVLGVVRLISSARTMFAKSGPGLKMNSARSGCHTETPRMSEGSMSEVNWRRWNWPPMERARAAASVVLPTPGASSISTWPRARSPTTARRTTSGLPTMQRPMLASSRAIGPCESLTQPSNTRRAVTTSLAAPAARAGLVRGRRVNGHEEERRAARVTHVVTGLGRNHHQASRPAAVLPGADPHDRLALDDIDDLVALVLLFRSGIGAGGDGHDGGLATLGLLQHAEELPPVGEHVHDVHPRSEEHTSELQSLAYLVCRLLLEKKKKIEKKEGHRIKHEMTYTSEHVTSTKLLNT